VSEDLLYTDPELAQFYDFENSWAEDFDFCAELAKGAGSVLDLGCGTGQFLAENTHDGYRAGVDPAGAMLEVARQREGGQRVKWVQADARSLDLGERFDLIMLTSHTFQVFLTDSDQNAVLGAIRRHLAPNGRFVFDSRNPAAQAWKRWTPTRSKRPLKHPVHGDVQVWNDAHLEGSTQIVSYKTFYQPKNSTQVFSASSRIRFTPQAELAARIEAAGLTVSSWLGSWGGTPYSANTKEIIPLGMTAI